LAKLLAAAVLFIAAAGYPARNVLLLVADDAGLEVSQWSFFLKSSSALNICTFVYKG
jgi:hypothetical protein